MDPVERPRWPYPSKLVISLLVLGLAIYLLSSFSVVIPPLIIAIIIAFVLSPIAKGLQRRLHLPRILAIMLSYLIAILVVVLFPSIIIPWLASEFANLNPGSAAHPEHDRERPGAPVPDPGLQALQHQRVLLSQVISGLQGLVEPIVGQTLNLAVSLISSIVWLISS